MTRVAVVAVVAVVVAVVVVRVLLLLLLLLLLPLLFLARLSLLRAYGRVERETVRARAAQQARRRAVGGADERT